MVCHIKDWNAITFTGIFRGTCISLTADVRAVTYRTQTDANAQYLHPIRALKMQTHARSVSGERAGVRLIEHMLRSWSRIRAKSPMPWTPCVTSAWCPICLKTGTILLIHLKHTVSTKTCDTDSHFVQDLTCLYGWLPFIYYLQFGSAVKIHQNWPVGSETKTHNET